MQHDESIINDYKGLINYINKNNNIKTEFLNKYNKLCAAGYIAMPRHTRSMTKCKQLETLFT